MPYDEDTDFELLDIIRGMFDYTLTEQVSDLLGGKRVHVPKDYVPDNPLCNIMGKERFALLAKQIGGVPFYVRMSYRRAELIRTVRTLSEAGTSIPEIARKARLSERQVARIRRRLRDDGKLPA